MTGAPPAPGALLLAALDALHWSQMDLADVLDRPAQWVSTVANGKKEITRISALQLAAALGTTPEYWLDAQDAHRLWLLDQDPAHRARLDAIRRRAERVAAAAPRVHLNPADFPGFSPEQLAKLESIARRMGRQIRDQAT